MSYEGKAKDIGIIELENGKQYLIEGHRRTVANYKNGIFRVGSKILMGTAPQLEIILSKRDIFTMQGLVNNLR